MTTIYDVDANELILNAAKKLKQDKLVAPPTWAAFVKTGVHKERPPVDADWWYIRAAAILRTVYRQGPIGVSKLRTKFGGRQNTGYKPEHHYKGSGNIARKVLQQLEKSGLVKNEQKGQHKGRIITSKGKSFLDKISTEMSKASSSRKEKEAKKGETPEIPANV